MQKLRKNKPASKSTMLDFIKESQDPSVKQTAIAQSNIHAFKYTEEYMKQVKEYNMDLKRLDPLYSSIKPLHEILVRFQLHEPVLVGNLVMPFKQAIPAPTNSGVSKYTDIESDFPYKLVAVVVAAPESNQLKAGEMVMLSRRAITMNVIGTGANAKLQVEQGFVHPESQLHDIPTDVTNQHYGYALVQYHEVKAKL